MRKVLVPSLALLCLSFVPGARAATPGNVVVAAGISFPQTTLQTTSSGAYQITLTQGQDIEFVNLDSAIPHTVTECRTLRTSGSTHTCNALSTDPSPRFDSGSVTVPQAKEITAIAALAPGTYRFFCTVHGYDSMHGTFTIAA